MLPALQFMVQRVNNLLLFCSLRKAHLCSDLHCVNTDLSIFCSDYCVVLGIQQTVPQTLEILVEQNKEMLLSLASDKLGCAEQTNSSESKTRQTVSLLYIVVLLQ